MLVKALVEYTTNGGDHRIFERFEKEYRQESNARTHWKVSLIYDLLSRGVVCDSIKAIEVEYVRN